MRKLILISLIFLIVGILSGYFSFYFSTTPYYTRTYSLSLSDLSGKTIPIPPIQGKIVVKGYTNSSVKIEVVKEIELIKFENVSGSFSIESNDPNANEIVIINGIYPSNISLQVEIYNYFYQQLFIIISGIFIVLSLILFAYSRVLR